MNTYLYQLNKDFRYLLLTYLIIISCGLSVGLIYLSQNTKFSANDTVEHFKGSLQDNTGDEVNIPDKYPKPISELLMTTHNHIFGLGLIFFSISLIFYFSSVINGFWKSFLMIEPLISILITFGSIWGIRFIHPDFVYLTILSAILMYSTIFLMIILSVYELVFYRSFK